MIDMKDDDYLADALARLGSRRRMFAAVLCAQRDRSVDEGEHDFARVWNALADKIASQL